MQFVTPMRVVVFLVAALALFGLATEPEVLVQAFVRGGFVLAGIALVLALKPAHESLLE